MKTAFDVIVVGAGAAGAIVASELAQAGQQVLLLDKGPAHTTEDFKLKHDEIRYYARGALVPSMDTDPITWRETTSDAHRTRSLGGGTTRHRESPSPAAVARCGRRDGALGRRGAGASGRASSG